MQSQEVQDIEVDELRNYNLRWTNQYLKSRSEQSRSLDGTRWYSAISGIIPIVFNISIH